MKRGRGRVWLAVLSLSLSAFPLFTSLFPYPPPSSLAVNVGEDCPVFDGLFEFCQLSASGSIGE